MITGFKAVGGRLNATLLTNKLSDEEYDLTKVYVWLAMIRDRQRPTKWFKRNKEGTKVSFTVMNTTEDVARSAKEFQEYLDEFNTKYDADLKVTMGETKNEDS